MNNSKLSTQLSPKSKGIIGTILGLGSAIVVGGLITALVVFYLVSETILGAFGRDMNFVIDILLGAIMTVFSGGLAILGAIAVWLTGWEYVAQEVVNLIVQFGA